MEKEKVLANHLAFVGLISFLVGLYPLAFVRIFRRAPIQNYAELLIVIPYVIEVIFIDQAKQ